MADKKYYWLKLKKDFFKRHDIKIIEAMPNGKDYILFYLKLLVESVDHNGSLRFNDTVPYDEKMLSVITSTDIDKVRSAMKIFTELKMIEVLEDRTIFMAEVENMLGSETYWAERKRIQKHKLLAEQDFKYINKLSYEQLQLPNGKIQYVDNKRYGGNAFIAFELAQGKCESCGTYDDLCIHHMNGFSNELDDLKVLCRRCHRKLEILSLPPTEIGKSPIKVQLMSNLSKQEIELDIEIEKEIDKDIKKYKYSSSQMLLAEKLKSLILANNPNAKVPKKLDQWANDIRLIIERDKRIEDDVGTVIEWSQKDSFWQANILSASKLRKQYDTLYMQMNRDKPAGSNHIPWKPPQPKPDQDCPTCAGKGWYTARVPFNNGLSMRDEVVTCQCAKKNQ